MSNRTQSDIGFWVFIALMVVAGVAAVWVAATKAIPWPPLVLVTIAGAIWISIPYLIWRHQMLKKMS
jgi:hypothetical protein